MKCKGPTPEHHQGPNHGAHPWTMKQPNRLLLEASARLYADGHPDLASDLRQLARRWTPADEQELCGRGQRTANLDEPA